MWNRIRLWLSKNDRKIIAVVLVIMAFLFFIRGANNYAKNQQQEKVEEYATEEKNESIFEDAEYDEKDMTELSNSQEEYDTVYNVAKKFVNYVYKANRTQDVSDIKNVLDMCGDRFINNLTNDVRKITTDNVMNFMFKLDNLNEYSFRNIYMYSQSNNVKRYIIDFEIKRNQNVVDSYMVINLDFNNKTFSYDGNYMNLNYLNSNEKINEIENKIVNTF